MNLDKIVAAHKAQLIVMHEMTSNALAAVEKIAELNLQAAKASLEHHTGHAHELLSVKDVKALSRLQAKALEPLAEKAAAYNRSLYEIVSDMNSECASIAQAQIGQAQKQFLESVETALSHVPMGSEKLVDSVKTAVNDTTKAMKTLQEVVKTASGQAQDKLNAVAETAVKVAKSAAAGVGA